MKNRTVSTTGNENINALLAGAMWGDGELGQPVELTYSFPAGDSWWAYDEESSAGWYGLNSSARPFFEAALASWTQVSGLTITEIADTHTYGDIRVAYSQGVDDNSSAHAYLPGPGTPITDPDAVPADDAPAADVAAPVDDTAPVVTPPAPLIVEALPENGDIWLHPATTAFSPGGHDYYTLLHEIGHALGLKHSFETEGEFLPLEASYESDRYTVMSYTSSEAAGFRYTNLPDNLYSETVIKPTTPMLYDVRAIQYLYGANADYRSADDIWRFESSGNLMTIWDGGGNDTIDLSDQLIAANLTLEAGKFSDIGQRQMSYHGVLEAATDNVAIAFGVEIENAIGSAFNDTLLGNSLNNRLTGGGGNDLLDGGEGDDAAVFIGNRADYQLKSSKDGLTVQGADGLDVLKNIETLVFDDEELLVADLDLPSTDPVTPLPTRQSDVVLTPAESDTAYFLLELSQPLTTTASVNYETRDGTALAGEDYVAKTGTATLKAGQTFIAIGVELIDDKVQEANEYFHLAVTSPVGGVFSGDAVELIAQRIILDDDSIA